MHPVLTPENTSKSGLFSLPKVKPVKLKQSNNKKTRHLKKLSLQSISNLQTSNQNHHHQCSSPTKLQILEENDSRIISPIFNPKLNNNINSSDNSSSSSSSTSVPPLVNSDYSSFSPLSLSHRLKNCINGSRCINMLEIYI